ncbi:MAG: FAD:protein FMN transferase [Candidatus Omnitrophica bacterium]|nr:FAD:protein FMN transferase [Candidatus Omnitrophota bacterium]
MRAVLYFKNPRSVPRFFLRSVPLSFILAFLLCGCQSLVLHRETQVLMGTFVEVVSPDPRAPEIVFSEIRRIEGMLSKYRPESEISQLNKNGQVKASPEMFYILEKSVGFWELSQGVFDVTVGPLMDLWGFTKKEFRQPSAEEIREALKIIGSNKIILNKQDYVVKFMLPGMKVDLGAIAKGFAVDCAVRKLKDSGISSCLINAGGQIYGLGDKSGRPWKVAIRSPRGEGVEGYLEIKDQAVSTSGDYEQYFEKDKRRFSHIMNPHTGYPEDSKIISATVIADDGLTADALSTSIVVMGKDKGLLLAKKFPGVKTRIIERSDK